MKYTHEQYKDALKIVNDYKSQIEEHYNTVKKELESNSKFANVTKKTKIVDTHISVRLYNILRSNEDRLGINFDREKKVSNLSNLSMSKFLQCRYAGKGTLQELKELCFFADVKLNK